MADLVEVAGVGVGEAHDASAGGQLENVLNGGPDCSVQVRDLVGGGRDELARIAAAGRRRREKAVVFVLVAVELSANGGRDAARDVGDIGAVEAARGRRGFGLFYCGPEGAGRGKGRPDGVLPFWPCGSR